MGTNPSYSLTLSLPSPINTCPSCHVLSRRLPQHAHHTHTSYKITLITAHTHSLTHKTYIYIFIHKSDWLMCVTPGTHQIPSLSLPPPFFFFLTGRSICNSHLLYSSLPSLPFIAGQREREREPLRVLAGNGEQMMG